MYNLYNQNKRIQIYFWKLVVYFLLFMTPDSLKAAIIIMSRQIIIFQNGIINRAIIHVHLETFFPSYCEIQNTYRAR